MTCKRNFSNRYGELKWYLNAIKDDTEFSIDDVDELKYILGIFNLNTTDYWIPISVKRFISEDINDIVDDGYDTSDLGNISTSELIDKIVDQLDSLVTKVGAQMLETITYKNSKQFNMYVYTHGKIYGDIDIVYVEADDDVLYIKGNDIPKLIKSL